MRKTGFANKPRKPLKRTALRKKGTVGQANQTARNKISEISEQLQLTQCEIKLPGCLVTWPLAPAHRHKRAWYKGNAELLADYDQWVCACQVCHDKIEHDAALTTLVFEKLRP